MKIRDDLPIKIHIPAEDDDGIIGTFIVEAKKWSTAGDIFVEGKLIFNCVFTKEETDGLV